MSSCATTINVCLQTVKALAILMAPFLPLRRSEVRGLAGPVGGELALERDRNPVAGGTETWGGGVAVQEDRGLAGEIPRNDSRSRNIPPLGLQRGHT